MKDAPKNGTVPLAGNPAVPQHKRMAAGDKQVGTVLPGGKGGKTAAKTKA